MLFLITLILMIIALILYSLLFIIGSFLSLFKSTKQERYFQHIHAVLSILLNVIGSPFFNLTCIKNDAYKFGNIKDSTSKVFGVNRLSLSFTHIERFKRLLSGKYYENKLTYFGSFIAWCLGDKHLKKSIG